MARIWVPLRIPIPVQGNQMRGRFLNRFEPPAAPNWIISVNLMCTPRRTVSTPLTPFAFAPKIEWLSPGIVTGSAHQSCAGKCYKRRFTSTCNETRFWLMGTVQKWMRYHRFTAEKQVWPGRRVFILHFMKDPLICSMNSAKSMSNWIKLQLSS